jgi:Fic family protein
VQGGHSAIAGRLAGAYRAIHENEMAERIVKDMETTGFNVRETNPFDRFTPSLAQGTRVTSPYISRIEVMWRSMREKVQEVFPDAPGLPGDPDDYLRKVDEIYVDDAYNSLSIEGYQVNPELIEKIKRGEWKPESSASDRQQRDAMAAKGYNLAFQSVKDSIRKLLTGDRPSEVISINHQEWYKQMFLPSVQAGFSKVEDLIGYRNTPVYIKGSQHVPPSASAVVDCIETLFDLLKGEEHAGIRAVLGHFVFVFIHPYMGGNGRIGRLLMNTLLASGGYPWTVIRLERREQYMLALEEASVRGNIGLFAEFIKGEMNHI